MIEKTFKANDCNLNFFEHNIGAKETILYIHGWTAGWEVWMNDIHLKIIRAQFMNLH